MLAYGTPVITPKEKARQEEEVKIYLNFMEDAFNAMRRRHPWEIQEAWWAHHEPNLRFRERKAVERGIKAMSDAYDARNPRVSYFEIRNRRWERYKHDIVAPANARVRVCESDIRIMWQRYNDLSEMETLEAEEKQEALDHMKAVIDELEKRFNDEFKQLEMCRKIVDETIYKEGIE